MSQQSSTDSAYHSGRNSTTSEVGGDVSSRRSASKEPSPEVSSPVSITDTPRRSRPSQVSALRSKFEKPNPLNSPKPKSSSLTPRSTPQYSSSPRSAFSKSLLTPFDKPSPRSCKPSSPPVFGQSMNRKSASDRIKELEEKQKERKPQESSDRTAYRPKIPEKPKLSTAKEGYSPKHPALVAKSSLTKITTNVKTVLYSQDSQSTLTKTLTTVTRTTSNSLSSDEKEERISPSESDEPISTEVFDSNYDNVLETSPRTTDSPVRVESRSSLSREFSSPSYSRTSSLFSIKDTKESSSVDCNDVTPDKTKSPHSTAPQLVTSSSLLSNSPYSSDVPTPLISPPSSRLFPDTFDDNNTSGNVRSIKIETEEDSTKDHSKFSNGHHHNHIVVQTKEPLEDDDREPECEFEDSEEEEEGAEILDGPHDVMVTKGQSATLSLTFTGYPVPEVTWLKKVRRAFYLNIFAQFQNFNEIRAITQHNSLFFWKLFLKIFHKTPS